jgi:hypothetical protein
MLTVFNISPIVIYVKRLWRTWWSTHGARICLRTLLLTYWYFTVIIAAGARDRNGPGILPRQLNDDIAIVSCEQPFCPDRSTSYSIGGLYCCEFCRTRNIERFHKHSQTRCSRSRHLLGSRMGTFVSKCSNRVRFSWFVNTDNNSRWSYKYVI